MWARAKRRDDAPTIITATSDEEFLLLDGAIKRANRRIAQLRALLLLMAFVMFAGGTFMMLSIGRANELPLWQWIAVLGVACAAFMLARWSDKEISMLTALNIDELVRSSKARRGR